MGKYRLAVLIAGASAVISQSLNIREGLVLFSGNELTFGIMLGGWLAGTGLGGLLGGRRTGAGNPTRVLTALFGLLVSANVFAHIFLRFAPFIFGLPYGEVVSLERMIYISLVALVPCGMILGAIFPVASRLIPAVEAYMYEGIGSFLGGILCAVVLIPMLPALGILVILISLVLLGLALVHGHRWLWVLALLPLALVFKINGIEFSLRKIAGGKRELISTVETKYGRSSVFRSGQQYDFFTSGVYDFSCPDAYRAEMAVHYSLLLHPNPRQVLLVGGGMGGGRSEILKHPSVRVLTYAEMDPQFYRWAENFVTLKTPDSSRYRTVFGDARFFVNHTRERFDAVIINLPDPVNGQLNRFYTREFFTEARRVLRPGGILAVGVSAPPDIVSPFYAEFLRTIRSAVASAFAWVRVLPADKVLFVAADRDLGGDAITDLLSRRIAERNLPTLYVTVSYVRANLNSEKINYYDRTLRQATDRENRDLKPVCYYYTMILWSGLGSNFLKKFFIGISRVNPAFFFLPLLLVFLFFRRRALVYLSLIASGAGSLAMELVLMVLFQLTYGYVYGWVAPLIAAFMAGLAAGAWISTKRYSGQPGAVRRLSDWSLANAGIIGLAVLTVLLRAPGKIFFIPALLLAGGLVNGIYFSLVLGFLGPRRAGLAYGLDLIGSSLAALAVSVLLIPLLGVTYTLLGFMSLNLLVAAGIRTIK